MFSSSRRGESDATRRYAELQVATPKGKQRHKLVHCMCACVRWVSRNLSIRLCTPCQGRCRPGPTQRIFQPSVVFIV